MKLSNKYLVLWIIISLIIIMFYRSFNKKPEPVIDVNYTEFLAMVDDERVGKVIIQDQEIFFTDAGGKHFKLFAPRDSDLIKILKKKGVGIEAKPQ